MAGTEDWRAAVSYPELARYFELAATKPRTMPGVPVKVAPPRVVESIGQRVVQELLYPIAGGEALIIIAVLLLFAALYYPACLATIAVWDSILDSLNPAYVFHVIGKIGADYFIVVAMWFVATLGTMLMSSPFLNPLAAVPIVGRLFASALSFWALFDVSHLLGYAVYRHSPALGWQ